MNQRLTIQIVGWNSAKELTHAVKELKTIPSDQVVIRYIDNHSTDNSIEVVNHALPHADIMALHANFGFTGAHNRGFVRCTTPFVLTHDPDVEISWDGIQKLLEYFDDEKIAATQGKLMRAEENAIDSTGIVMTRTLNGKERGAGENDEGQYNSEHIIDAATGACGIFRMSALRDVAHKADVNGIEIFDEDFFAYKDDVDLGWRLRNKGWKIMYYPVFMGTHRRTLGQRGRMLWIFYPSELRKRLPSLRTSYSIRNYVWMLIKNISFKQELTNGLFIFIRLLTFFVTSVLYFKLFPVWIKTIHGIPRMIEKRAKKA